jgi:hypothetical protein
MAKMTKGKLPTNEILGIIAGSVAAGFAAKAVNQFLPTAPAPVKNLIPVGLGVFLAMQRNPLVKGAGFGMIAKGSASIVEAFGLGQPNVDELFLFRQINQSYQLRQINQSYQLLMMTESPKWMSFR